jgi:hypothetical protein
MATVPRVDGVLLEWGTPLLWPRAKGGDSGPGGKLVLPGGGVPSPAAVRSRIQDVVQHVPQVVVKLTGGGRGMKAISSHLRYITKSGELALMDERGEVFDGPDAVREVSQEWRWAGTCIPQQSDRREAFHFVLDMPCGVDPEVMQDAAREFAGREFAGHKYAWAYHGHQGHPHVHLVVRAEGKDFRRLNPRKDDLNRWRESLAESLRRRGVQALATRRIAHGSIRNEEPIWVVKARQSGTLRQELEISKRVTISKGAQEWALQAWARIHNALEASPDPADQQLAREVKAFLDGSRMVRHLAGRARIERQQHEQRQQHDAVQQTQERNQSRGVSPR